MHATYKNALMWTLYGAFFLLLTVLQTVVFGRARFFDVKLSILPVCIACVAMLCGAEAGALYGLCCGTVWCFTGASGGALHIVLMTICGGDGAGLLILLCTLCAVAVGYLCDRYLVRRLLSALIMSLLALTVCQTILFLFQCYLGTIYIGTIYTLPIQIGLSLLSCPLIYLGAWAIRKVGAK